MFLSLYLCIQKSIKATHRSRLHNKQGGADAFRWEFRSCWNAFGLCFSASAPLQVARDENTVTNKRKRGKPSSKPAPRRCCRWTGRGVELSAAVLHNSRFQAKWPKKPCEMLWFHSSARFERKEYQIWMSRSSRSLYLSTQIVSPRTEGEYTPTPSEQMYFQHDRLQLKQQLIQNQIKHWYVHI